MATEDQGLVVDGLTEAIRALNNASKQSGQRARDALAGAAKDIQTRSQNRMRGRPGGGSYPRRKGMVGRSATRKGAGVKLRGGRYPWAWAAEYGSKRAWVFGRVMSAGKLRRRQFPVWRGNQFVVRGRSGPGWIIQPTIRDNIVRVTEDIADALDELLDEEMNKAGVPRGIR